MPACNNTDEAAGADARRLAWQDISSARREYLFTPPQSLYPSLARLLCDKRDLPALFLLLNVALLAVPAAVSLHCMSQVPHWLGAAYMLLNYALFMQRFMLTLHFTEHRKLFAGGWGFLNYVAPSLLCVLFGVPSGAYRLHHCVMHHVEDNGSPWDLSSTEPFQRDSLPQFLMYWLRFCLAGCIELPLYAWRRQRRRWAVQSSVSMLLYWMVMAVLWRRNHVATLYTLVLPYVLSSFLLMFGNWCQHIFVDPDSPSNDYTLTYNCIASSDNSRTYNDGYHIQHHLNSRLHWSELPHQFMSALDAHDKHDALVFQGIGVFDVGVAVFRGERGLAWLAEHVVPCGPTQATRSREEWVALMRHRLKPILRQSSGKGG